MTNSVTISEIERIIHPDQTPEIYFRGSYKGIKYHATTMAIVKKYDGRDYEPVGKAINLGMDIELVVMRVRFGKLGSKLTHVSFKKFGNETMKRIVEYAYSDIYR